MPEPLRIAVAGLGTVGLEVVRLLQTEADLIADRARRPVEVVAVSARDRSRDRGIDLSAYRWFDDAAEMASAADCEMVVEVIGGSEGPAKDVCEAALKAGRHVVTANKALIAIAGRELIDLADQAGKSIVCEAAVAGGIPIIKGLREGLAANQISSVFGILNGTCNYILTRMEETGRAFEDILAEAQELGYAEADPAFDIDGVDAAHKLAILAAIAFNTHVDFDQVTVEGIRPVTAADIKYADKLGYRIKLLGLAARVGEGAAQKLTARVGPVLVPKDRLLARIDGVFNTVVADGHAVGPVMMVGAGAGGGPTASAIIADIVDIARGQTPPAFGVSTDKLANLPIQPIEERVGMYYIRAKVIDQPGVLADITACLRDEDVSVDSLIQRGRAPGETVSLVIVTHDAVEAAVRRAMTKISAIDAVLQPPTVLRIEPSLG